MLVSVLTVLPTHDLLTASAMGASLGLENVSTHPSFQIDPTFAAVPLGNGDSSSLTMESMEIASSENFVVRGFLDVDSQQNLPREVGGQPIFADPVIAPFITCGGTPPVGGVPQVKAGLNVAALAARGLNGDEVAVAIMDTGINLAHLRAKLGAGATINLDVANSWRPAGVTTSPGAHPVDHGSMCAFDVLIAAPKATLLDYPLLRSSAPGGAQTGRTLSIAVQAYAQLIAFWAVAFAPGGAPLYKGLVVNNSWGIFHPSWDFPPGHPGRYIDNPNHPFTGLVSLLARSGADILFSAGNCGANCADLRCQGKTTRTIVGANASLDVLTLAGCDTLNARVGYSSQGPSIAHMPQNKPDVTTYTHFLGSEAFGANSPDSGTSAACPVAAGCVAALRTKLPRATTPGMVFDALRNTATPKGGAPGSTGWNGDYGHGVMNPNAAALALGV